MAVLGTASEGRRGGFRVRLLGATSDRREEISALLLGLAELSLEVVDAPVEGQANGNGALPPDIVMVLFNGNEDTSLGYLQSQAELRPRPALFALLQERSAGLMRRILRLGADEILFLPLDQADLLRALFKVNEIRRRAERDGRGEIFSVVSMVGGVGVTTISANLALALALRQAVNKRVAIVDLDLQSAGLTTILNVTPERTIVPLTRVEKKLDSIQLEAALSKHPSGLHLLAAPKRIEDSELVSHVTVGAVLDLMRELFDFVVVDSGSHIDENGIAAWERSETLLYILDQTVAAARSAWRFVDLFERLGIAGVEPRFVLNRYVSSHPISEKQITQTLGRSIYAKVPRDDRVLERAQLHTRQLWDVAPNSPLARSLEDLATRITAKGEIPTEATGGVVSRLLAAIGSRSRSVNNEAN